MSFCFVSLVAQAVQRDPVSGAYLIFYMGSTDNGTVKTGGGKCADKPETQSLCNQRVGLAYSMSPNGWVSTSLSRRLLMPAKDLNSSRSCFASTRSMIDCLASARPCGPHKPYHYSTIFQLRNELKDLGSKIQLRLQAVDALGRPCGGAGSGRRLGRPVHLQPHPARAGEWICAPSLQGTLEGEL